MTQSSTCGGPLLVNVSEPFFHMSMIVVWAREIPRSGIISTRSRKLSLNPRYYRTHRMMVSRSKWRPLKRSSMLGMLVGFVVSLVSRQICPACLFAPEPLQPDPH